MVAGAVSFWRPMEQLLQFTILFRTVGEHCLLDELAHLVRVQVRGRVTEDAISELALAEV